MAFKLNSVVPWGRSMQEYRKMFLLNVDNTKIIDNVGDREFLCGLFNTMYAELPEPRVKK